MTKIKNGKSYLVPLLLAIVAAALLVYFFGFRDRANNESDAPNDSGYINYGPPTEEEKQQAEQNKNDIVNESQNTVDPGAKKVEPTVTFAGMRNGNVEVRSYVSGIYEDGGECEAKFTNGSHVVTRTVEGIRDATYTRCDRILIEPSEFAVKGTWNLVITYSSNTASGKSSVKEVVIQ
jgi:hypothetical protein